MPSAFNLHCYLLDWTVQRDDASLGTEHEVIPHRIGRHSDDTTVTSVEDKVHMIVYVYVGGLGHTPDRDVERDEEVCVRCGRGRQYIPQYTHSLTLKFTHTQKFTLSLSHSLIQSLSLSLSSLSPTPTHTHTHSLYLFVSLTFAQ
jgi:hypothetical protein